MKYIEFCLQFMFVISRAICCKFGRWSCWLLLQRPGLQQIALLVTTINCMHNILYYLSILKKSTGNPVQQFWKSQGNPPLNPIQNGNILSSETLNPGHFFLGHQIEFSTAYSFLSFNNKNKLCVTCLCYLKCLMEVPRPLGSEFPNCDTKKIIPCLLSKHGKKPMIEILNR